MRKIKFIYFDVGGVLIDYKDAFKGVSEKFNIPIPSINDIWLSYADPVTRGLLSPQDLWNNIRKELLIEGGEDFDFLTSWVEDYKPIKTIHTIVKKFINKYKVGLLTNLYKGMIPILKEKKLIPDVTYTSIITSYETGLKKPEKKIYELATTRVNLEPHEIFFVDDREDFIEGAKQMGWRTFLFNPNNIPDSANRLKKILE